MFRRSMLTSIDVPIFRANTVSDMVYFLLDIFFIIDTVFVLRMGQTVLIKNSVDQDQTNAASDQGLQCLQNIQQFLDVNLISWNV